MEPSQQPWESGGLDHFPDEDVGRYALAPAPTAGQRGLASTTAHMASEPKLCPSKRDWFGQ